MPSRRELAALAADYDTTGSLAADHLALMSAAMAHRVAGGHIRMRYVFGDCTLDTEIYVVQRADQTIPMRLKVFQVLY
jgi:hypothetical protein